MCLFKLHGGGSFSSLHTSCKWCSRLGALSLQNICSSSGRGRKKVTSITKAALQTFSKCRMLHSWSSHCFSGWQPSSERRISHLFTSCWTALTQQLSVVIRVCTESQCMWLLNGTSRHCLNTSNCPHVLGTSAIWDTGYVLLPAPVKRWL